MSPPEDPPAGGEPPQGPSASSGPEREPATAGEAAGKGSLPTAQALPKDEQLEAVAEALATRPRSATPGRQQMEIDPQVLRPAGGQVRSMMSLETWMGPLPPPDTLAKYGEVRRDLVDRIVSMAERQASHRQAIETKLVDSQTRNATLGVVFGFVIGLAGLGAAAYAASIQHPTVAVVIATVDLVGLVGVFVTGRVRSTGQKKQESEEGPESNGPAKRRLTKRRPK